MPTADDEPRADAGQAMLHSDDGMYHIDASLAVLVVDADPSARREHAEILKSNGCSVEAFASAEEFLEDCGASTPAGCLLSELGLPGMSGLDLQRHLRQLDWTLPVIFLTRCGTIPAAVQAMTAGAVVFLEKPVDSEVLIRWVREALARDARLREARAQKARLQSRLDQLSDREREGLRYVVAGNSSKEIASALYLSDKTVQLHRARIMKKTGAGNVAELVSLVHAAEGEPITVSSGAHMRQIPKSR
ncbi:MAG: response regulator transcription factor [Tepidisphaerales bacterium]